MSLSSARPAEGAMEPLLHKVKDHEDKLDKLAGRIRSMTDGFPLEPAQHLVEDRPIQESSKSRRDTEILVKDLDFGNIEFRLLDMDTVMKDFRDYNKTKRGFRSLCCISVYFLVVIFVFWASNHQQSLNNSYTRLQKALGPLNPQAKLNGTSSYGMWNSVKSEVIQKVILPPNKRVPSPPECHQDLAWCHKDTYKFGQFAYLVGPVTVTFSFGKWLPGKEDVEGFPSLRPFRQHMHEEKQSDEKRDLGCAGIDHVDRNADPFFLTKWLGYAFGPGYRLHIPSSMTNITDYLDCFTTFVNEEEVFDVSLRFTVYDPTTNPADWNLEATTAYGFVQATYSISPPYTVDDLVVGENGAWATTEFWLVPHDVYNFEKDPKWSMFLIFLEIAIILGAGLRYFIWPQIKVLAGHHDMQEYCRDTRSKDVPWYLKLVKSCRCHSSDDQEVWSATIQNHMVKGQDYQKFLKAVTIHCPDETYVARDRSGKPAHKNVVFALVVLLGFCVVLKPSMIFFRSQAANALQDPHLYGDANKVFENNMMMSRFCQDVSRIVQIFIIILLLMRILDHASFHPEIANLAQTFSAISSDFISVGLGFVFMCIIAGASSSILWGEKKPTLTGMWSATWFIFKSEFKLTALKDQIPPMLALGFNVAVDLLLFKILTGMIVDSYKKLKASTASQKSKGFFAGYWQWILGEINDIYGTFATEGGWGYVHPLQMACACHLHRRIKRLKMQQANQNSREDDFKQRLNDLLEEDFIVEQAEIIKALNRVYCLSRLDKSSKDIATDTQGFIAKYEVEVNRLNENRKAKEGQEPAENGLPQERFYSDDELLDKGTLEVFMKDDETKQELFETCLKLREAQEVCNKSTWSQHITGETWKFCDVKDARYAQAQFGMTSATASYKLMERLQEQQAAKKAKEKKEKEAPISKVTETDLRTHASNLCYRDVLKHHRQSNTRSPPDDVAQRNQLAEGRKYFTAFDIHCVGMMDVRFTTYWAQQLKKHGLSQTLTADDYRKYMTNDPFFWEWEELEKLIKDPQNQTYKGDVDYEFRLWALTKKVSGKVFRAASDRMISPKNSGRQVGFSS